MSLPVRLLDESYWYLARSALNGIGAVPLPKACATLVSPAPVKVTFAIAAKLIGPLRFNVPAAEPIVLLPVRLRGPAMVFVPLILLMAPTPPAPSPANVTGTVRLRPPWRPKVPPAFATTRGVEPRAVALAA